MEGDMKFCLRKVMLNFTPDFLMLQWRMKTYRELACIQKIADVTDKNDRIQMMKHEVFFDYSAVQLTI